MDGLELDIGAAEKYETDEALYVVEAERALGDGSNLSVEPLGSPV